MLYYIPLHYFSADNATAPKRWSFKIQSCISRSCIFRNIGPANSGPAFSGLPFSAPPVQRILDIQSPLRKGCRRSGRNDTRQHSFLHTNHKVVYNDAECATLVSTFCQFFVDKVVRIRDNMSLKSTERRVFVGRPHFGELLSSFQPVPTKGVRRLMSTMPSKSSPLDVLPCSLLKSCADVFAPVIARLSNLSMPTGQVQASTGATTVEESWSRQLAARKLQADLQSFDYLESTGAACTDTPAPSPARVTQFQSVPVRIQEGTFHRDRAARGLGWRLHCC